MDQSDNMDLSPSEVDQLVRQNLPASPAANLPMDPNLKADMEALLEAVAADASYSKLLKYKQGEWWLDDVMCEMGTRFLAHCIGYKKEWLKFGESGMLDRKVYSGLDRKNRPPQRDQLDDNDQSKWRIRDGKPSDPWVLQSSIPMERETGEVVLFVSRTFGGKRCISDLCKKYAQRTLRISRSEQPYVELGTGFFTTKSFNRIKCPVLEPVGWDSVKEGIRVAAAADTLQDEMNDEIPF